MAWKNGKKWVYSITYDEGCELLLEHALPVHRKYGVPGHVALVASQIGVPRNVPGSSYDGMMILSKEEIHTLAKEGWGVSCHSMVHGVIDEQTKRHEVVEARKLLEDTLEMSVPIFCVPGSNENLPGVLAAAEEAQLSAILTIYDRVNTLDSDLMTLGRVPLHHEYPPPFYSAYDPYKRIHQAIDMGGWIVDYCHCPMPGKPIHPWKDCTLEQLEERFGTVVRLGGKDVWLAEPNDVVEHVLTRRRS
jgi:peptidoglycan/xylan/chitin deacetylase (PgdA/CDA1 family)